MSKKKPQPAPAPAMPQCPDCGGDTIPHGIYHSHCPHCNIYVLLYSEDGVARLMACLTPRRGHG